MTSRERMLIALERGKPDRLPVTVHQWQPYHLNHFMGGMSDIEANRACGLDASINYYRTLEGAESPDWRVSVSAEPDRDGYSVRRTTITTPGGTLTCCHGANEMTTWVTEHLIKRPEDARLLRYMPVPRLDRAGAQRTRDELGDGGILRTFVCGTQGGCWQDACELVGVEQLIYATVDMPDWVHELMETLLDWKLRYIESELSGAPFDLIETGGGAASNTVISPALHREFCLPYDRRMHDALHSLGHRVVYHTCGGMTRILDSIVANGCDASETLSPAAVGGDIETDEDGARVREALAPHVALIGGMDQFGVLGRGDERTISAEVERLFRVFGGEGGYILSASDHFFDAPRENLCAFARAAARCTY